MWNNQDPREVFYNNRLSIIVLDTISHKISYGTLDTKKNYSLIVDNLHFRDDKWPDTWIWTVAPSNKDIFLTPHEELIIKQLLCAMIKPEMKIFSDYKDKNKSREELLSYLGGNAYKVAQAILDMYCTTDDPDQLKELVDKIDPKIKQKVHELFG